MLGKLRIQSRRITRPLKQLNSQIPYLRSHFEMLKVHTFTFNPFGENTYVLSTADGSSFLIDPGMSTAAEEQEIKTFIAEKDLSLKAILQTHTHIDHVLGLDFACRHFAVKAFMHPLEIPVFEANPRVASMYGVPYNHGDRPEFFDGNTLELGGQKIEILFVPGHCPGHVAFYHPASEILICGDTLFRESIGRTDLPGGDYPTLIKSIREVLFELPDSTTIYPGHMEPSTIGHEKGHNPFLN